MENKRRHERYAYPFEVEYSPKGDGMLYSRSIAKNISKGGICIPVLSRLVRTGDDILLEISHPEKRNSPVSVRGKVMWTREASDIASSLTSDAEAGIKFLEPTPIELKDLMPVTA